MNTARYAHLTFTKPGDWSLKMDQAWIMDILHTCGIRRSSLDDVIRDGGVLVLQAEHNRQYSNAIRDVLVRMPWCVLIVTSDECSLFEWDGPEWNLPNVRYWIQAPRPENPYPIGARFFGMGAPSSGFTGPWLSVNRRPTFAHFRGQVQHHRREAAVAALSAMGLTHHILCEPTEAFFAGLPRHEYLAELEHSSFVVCPAGSCTQDSFRVYEALQAGSIPIVDALRHDDGGEGFWDKIGMGWLPTLRNWHDLPALLERLCREDITDLSRDIRYGWSAHQSKTATALCEDIAWASGRKYT